MDTQPKPSEIVIMVSGLVAFISAFLAWYSAPAGFGSDANAFDSGLFPIALYIPLIGLAMGLHIALSKFGNVNFPERILGFSWPQIHLILGIFAVLLGVGYLILDLGDKGIGLWLAVLASVGLVVGAVLLNNEENTTSHSAGSVPPSPF